MLFRSLRLAVALEEWLAALNPFEGLRRMEAMLAIDASAPDDLRAHGVRVLGGARQLSGDQEGAITTYEASLELFLQIGDELAAAELMHRLALATLYVGDTQRARALNEEARVASTRAGAGARHEALGVRTLAQIEGEEGNIERGLELNLEAARIAREVDWTWWEGGALTDAALYAVKLGRAAEAEEWAREALALAHQIDDAQGLVYGLGLLVATAADRGDVRRAGRLWAAVESLESSGRPIGAWLAWGDRDEIAAALPMDDPEFDAARRQGRSLAVPDAVEFALSTPSE